MALPHFQYAFCASPTKPLINMFIRCLLMHIRQKDIELPNVNDPPIHTVLAHKNLGRFVDKVQNPQIKVQLKVWIREEFKLDHKLQIILWFAYDPDFKPNKMDHRFKSWVSKGITTSYSITGKVNFRKEYCLEKSDFFLQIHNHFELNINNETNINDPVLRVFTGAYQNDPNKGVISRFYKGLMTKNSTTEYIKKMGKRR